MELFWILSLVASFLAIVSGHKISSISPGSYLSCPTELPSGVHQNQGPPIPAHTFFPIGDRKSFHQMFEILGGTNVLKFEEFLKTGCLRRFMIDVVHEDLSDFIIAPGYSQVPMRCNYTHPVYYEYSCTFPNKDPKYNFRVSGVLADGKSFFLSVRCYNSGLYTWEVYGTGSVLEPEIVEKIKEKVTSLGFDWDETAIRIPYERCQMQSSEII